MFMKDEYSSQKNKEANENLSELVLSDGEVASMSCYSKESHKISLTIAMVCYG